MLKKIYLSPLGYLISLIQNILSFIHQPFMVYGFYNSVQSKFMKYTRISSSVKIMAKNKCNIYDNVWIGHYSLIDASNSVTIKEGVQTGTHISIFSHSSHNSIRLLGKSYLTHNSRIGYIIGSVEIGEYTFIGTSSVIFPGVKIGKGSLIKAGSIVTKSFPDYSIVGGNPAKLLGSTIELDNKYYKDKYIQDNYYDNRLIEKWMTDNKENLNADTIS